MVNPTSEPEQSMNLNYELSTDLNIDHPKNQSNPLIPRICQKNVSNKTSVIKNLNCVETCVDVICVETDSGSSTKNQQNSKK